MKTKLHQLDKFTILSLLDDQENMAHKSMGISQIIHSYYNNNAGIEVNLTVLTDCDIETDSEHNLKLLILRSLSILLH